MLQVTAKGKLFVDEGNIPHWRDQFKEQHLLKFPGFVEDSVLKVILRRLAEAQVSDNHYVDERTGRRYGDELVVDLTNAAFNIMFVLLNNSELFRVMEQITGISPLRNFMGRIFTLRPNSDQQLAWHDDNTENRMIGISINFSNEPFGAGVLRIRDRRSHRILTECANTGLGDAVIFRISDNIEHCVTPVEGSVNRTSCAGWFHSFPDFQTLIKYYKTSKSDH